MTKEARTAVSVTATLFSIVFGAWYLYEAGSHTIDPGWADRQVAENEEPRRPEEKESLIVRPKTLDEFENFCRERGIVPKEINRDTVLDDRSYSWQSLEFSVIELGTDIEAEEWERGDLALSVFGMDRRVRIGGCGVCFRAGNYDDVQVFSEVLGAVECENLPESLERRFRSTKEEG